MFCNCSVKPCQWKDASHLLVVFKYLISSPNKNAFSWDLFCKWYFRWSLEKIKKKANFNTSFTNMSETLLITAGNVSKLRLRIISVGSKRRRELDGFENYYFTYIAACEQCLVFFFVVITVMSNSNISLSFVEWTKVLL